MAPSGERSTDQECRGRGSDVDPALADARDAVPVGEELVLVPRDARARVEGRRHRQAAGWARRRCSCPACRAWPARACRCARPALAQPLQDHRRVGEDLLALLALLGRLHLLDLGREEGQGGRLLDRLLDLDRLDLDFVEDGRGGLARASRDDGRRARAARAGRPTRAARAGGSSARYPRPRSPCVGPLARPNFCTSSSARFWL